LTPELPDGDSRGIGAGALLVAERDDRPIKGADYPENHIGVELNSTLPVRTDSALGRLTPRETTVKVLEAVA